METNKEINSVVTRKETAQIAKGIGCVDNIADDIEKNDIKTIDDGDAGERKGTTQAEESLDPSVTVEDNNKLKTIENNKSTIDAENCSDTLGGDTDGPNVLDSINMCSSSLARKSELQSPKAIDESVKSLQNVPISKTVGLDDAEEGELDYEEEELADAENHHIGQEEGEILDEKDAEGSEEGEIVSDSEEQQVRNTYFISYYLRYKCTLDKGVCTCIWM